MHFRAVSYTHLDVYKRQGLTAAICAAHDTIQDGVEFLRAHMPAQDRGTVTPVSYTHLAVYKRQVRASLHSIWLIDANRSFFLRPETSSRCV